MDRNRTVVLAFMLAVLAGTTFRSYGLGGELPCHFHSDERVLVCFTEALRTAPSVERLGFQLIKTFKVRPSLLGYASNDDRVELSFRLFDHPWVLIFKRAEAVAAENHRR